jgi:hypothetical protein
VNRSVLAFIALALLTNRPALADPAFLRQVGLQAMSFAAASLPPGTRSASTDLTIDTARSAILIIATTEAIDFRLRLPDGSNLTPNSESNDRLRWLRVDAKGRAPGMLLPGLGSGSNVVISLRPPPAGRYQLAIERTTSSQNELPYVVSMLLDSDLRMGLWFASRQVFLDEPFLLSAILRNGIAPESGAQIDATLFQDPPDGVSKANGLGEVRLHDDGVGEDRVKDDGVYTAEIIPRVPGTMRIAVRGTGISSGRAFQRNLGGEFEVSKRTVEIRPRAAPPSPNPRTWFERGLAVPLELRGPAGRYEVTVALNTESGATTGENAIVELSDRTSLDIAFGPDRLKLLGDDAKITSAVIEAYELADTGKVLRGRLVRPL